MATYLVTGAAGFIASRVCELLLSAGHAVVGVDNFNSSYDVRLKAYRLAKLLRSNVQLEGSTEWMQSTAESWRCTRRQSLDGKFVFTGIDIEDLARLEALFAEFSFTAVFNLAARAGVRPSLEVPEVYLSTNTLGAINILKCMVRSGVTQQVLASTSSLYAGSPLPWSENQPVNTPLSPYAASKKAAELFAYSYNRMFQVHTTVVRYFTVFGPTGRPDMSIFRFIRWIDAGHPVEIYGDGNQSRDFTYVDDIARGTIMAAQPLGFEVVNLGGGRTPVTLLEVIARIEERLGKKACITYRPFHAADILESRADIAKAHRLLGWSPSVDFFTGLDQTITWYLENKYWLTNISLPE